MKIKLFLSVVCTFLFYSINGGIIDEKELFEKLSTDLLKFKEFIATSKAEYDKQTNNTSVFHGIKRFRLKDPRNSHASEMNYGSLQPVWNITLYAVNNQNYDQEITISDNEKRKVLYTGSITRCISPAVVYDSWSITADRFISWHDDIERTVIENKTYSTSYSVTNETVTELFITLLKPFKVNVSARSKVKVTTTFYSYEATWLYSVGAVLKIRTENFETSNEQSDDAVKAAALEFFGSEYWKNLTNYTIIIETLFDDLVLSEFLILVKRTKYDLERDIGKDELL